MCKKYFLFFFILVSLENFAQCAMCRAALESSDSPVTAEAVNDGIVFLMAVPYILVAILAFVIYKIKVVKRT
jgi:hypothetical protein